MTAITVHTLVKNEARFVWFAVMSVIEHVDKVLLWDTGSSDGTLEIIKEIQRLEDGRSKIEFREVGEVDPVGFTRVRQEMLDATDSDWFIVVDGDEIWWQDSIRYLVSEIREKGDKIESVVVPTINLVGDIFHRREESTGQYELAGKRGHLALRAVNRLIPGLRSERPHGKWGWTDGEGRMIQDRDEKNISFIDAPYLHATHLPRAGTKTKEFDVPKRVKKLKYEVGVPFPRDFYYPEVFFKSRPKIVPSPWVVPPASYWLRAYIETPIKRLKRRFLKGGVGY